MVVLLSIVFSLASNTKLAAQTTTQSSDNTQTAQSVQNAQSTAEGEYVSKPVWELGLGAGYFSGFDYPASRDPNNTGLVLPFFLYRSEVIRAAGRGVGAVAIERPRVKLDISLGGSLNAESSGNAARESMPDLDFLFEIGPRLNIVLSRFEHADGGRSTLRWLNSARAVLSSDFSSLDSQGFLFKSELEWRRKNIFGSELELQLQFDSTWATRRLHRYFYSVGNEFVTDVRPFFRADAGYLGSTLGIGIGYRITPALRLFTAVNFENYSGAANRTSPLFETENSITYALALVWTARSSKKEILIFDDD